MVISVPRPPKVTSGLGRVWDVASKPVRFDDGVALSLLSPAWAEAPRMALEARALKRSAVFAGDGVADGTGRGVVLVPGFLAGDTSLGTMGSWLARQGYVTLRALIRMNVDCPTKAIDRLETRVEALAEQTGDRVSIVGQSRGGQFAKALAARRPDLVRGIVTLGSPTTMPYGIHVGVALQHALVASLGSAGRPGLLSWGCLYGACCEEFRRQVGTPVAEEVGHVAVFSRTDGIVDHRSAADPQADERIEVRASHCGMAVHPGAYRAVHRSLERFAGDAAALASAAAPLAAAA